VGGLLVITAHPDDEVLIAGGTLAACAAFGVETGVVCLTSGELGTIADPALASHETLGEVRRAELAAACAELGVSFVECWNWPDGELSWSDPDILISQLADTLERKRPDGVITFGSDGLYYHPDHVAAHNLVLDAVAASTNSPAVYRSIWPKSVMAEVASELRKRGLSDGLWDIDPETFGTDELDGCFTLDVRPYAEMKLRALLAHRTQIAPGSVFVTDATVMSKLIETEWFAPVVGSGWLEELTHLLADGVLEKALPLG
jgi:N-acetyl-1-D-myo-inositol-2-amino-2-deoxy-alpha-D-glucopyranoside deacetylase